MFKVMHGAMSVENAQDMAEVAMIVIRLMAHNATNILIVKKDTPVTFTMDCEDKRGGRFATMSMNIGLIP